ncbi:hypothetical protein LTR37_009571 [Vermiconidia calcicola]|uniref:Uncharacterized protein n=1 Tax=Vermiconidia calcicola TaxID=1690605 RepID=A0ACC3N817_9PEZI|nr:hypothetical protein LTR37_009571 [Vermiconidia calcicola]
MPPKEEEAAPAGQQPKAPDKEQLMKSVTAARSALDAQNAAQSLKEKAMNAVNPKERLRLLQASYHKEVEAHGQSKWAKTLQTGAFQGAAGGGGIGAGVAVGLGGAVGTLVTGITALPTVLIGGLAGAATGGIHGPWITMGGNKKDKDKKSEADVHAEAVKEAEILDKAVEKGASTPPKPPELVEAEGEQEAAGSQQTPPAAPEPEGGAQPKKRKPKKLQVRSGNEIKPSPEEKTPEKKRPKKLEVRSASERKENI